MFANKRNVSSIPFINNISLSDLAKILDETEEWVIPLRNLLLNSICSEKIRKGEIAQIAILENDIRDAFRILKEKFNLIGKSKWKVGELQGTFSSTERSNEMPGSEPVTDLLRSVASQTAKHSSWIPYWRLSEMGGHLQWACPLDNRSKQQPPPKRIEVIHSWLYPGTGGPGMASARFRI